MTRLLSLLLLLFSLQAYAQPANDNPCSATVLPVSANCVFNTYTAAAATTTVGAPAPGCGTGNNDVWFRVTVPSSGVVVVSTQAGTMNDAAMAIYSGATCSGLTLLQCLDNVSGAEKMPKISLSGLIAGSTLWVRVWGAGNASNNSGNFGICASTSPANDEPCNAIALTVNSTCSFGQYSNENATPSISVPAPTATGCVGYSGGDVWFTAVVPSNGTLVVNTSAGVMTDGGMAIYSGSACSSLTLLECNDDNGTNRMPKITRKGLTPGSTVWIRVWENGNDNNGTFNICASTTPVNDEPCNAITLNVNTNCSYSTFTNENATSSVTPTPPAPGCANYSGGDVWFKTTVPANGILTFETQAGTLLDAGIALYSGTCSAMTLISCDDNDGPGLMPFITRLNLTPGSTVWIRMWDSGNNDEGTFSLCVTSPPPVSACLNNQPAGNTCATARPICSFSGYCGNTSASYTADSWTQLLTAFQTCVPPSSTTGATPTIENNSFLSFQASATSATFDVWVTGTTNYGGIQMLFFSATGCSGAVSCFGGYNNIIPYQRVTTSGLTIGNTYYLMIDGYGGDVANYVIDLVSGANVLNVAANPPVICAGGSTTLTANVANIKPGTDYRWTPSTGLSATTGATVTANPTVTTTYTASAVTGFCADTTKNQVTVTVNPAATVTVGANQTVCQGGSLTLAGGLGGSATTGTWTSSNGGTFSNINLPGAVYTPSITSGTVQLTLTSNDPDGTGPCTAAVSNMQVTVNPLIRPVFIACSSTSFSVSFGWNAVAGATSYEYTYSINGGAPSPVANTGLTSFTLNGLSQGDDVTLTVTPKGGAGTCFASSSQACTVQTCVPPVVSGTLSVCQGLTTQLSGSGTPAFPKPWDTENSAIATVSNTGLVTGVSAGSTGISYTNNAGCVTTVIVTVNPRITPLFTPVSPICSGGSFTLPTTSNNGISGDWSPSIDNLNTRTYTFTPSGAQCAVGTTMTVTVIPNPAPATVSPVSYCQNLPSNDLTAGGSNILWYTSASGGTGSTTAPTPSTATVGTTTYYVSQTVNGCESIRVPLTVTINPLPTVTVNNPTGCIASNVTMIATPGQTGDYNYDWSVPADATAPGNVSSFVATVSGNYSVIITDKTTGCESIADIGTATVIPAVTLSDIKF